MQPTDILLYFACPDNICHGAVQEIGIGLQDTSLCPRPPGEYENTPVTVSIQRGSKYGELVIPGTGVRGLQVQGRYLYFDANGENVLTPWTLSQSPTGRSRHPDEYNNWCSSIFVDSIKIAFTKFYKWSKSVSERGTPIILNVNDMSLPFGGRFDISGTWGMRNGQKHLYHRIGTSVDVNDSNLKPDELDELTKFMHDSGLNRDNEKDSVHYGFLKGNS